MKVTLDNTHNIEYYAGNQRPIIFCMTLLEGLLYDLESVNRQISALGKKNGVLYIDYIDSHVEYSPERTEPCQDFYGYFRLRWEDEPSETVGDYMTLEEMDGVLCALCDFVERAFPQCENG